MAETSAGRDGDIGEDIVRALATRAGFVVHEPSRDRKGWDKQFEVTPHQASGVLLDHRVPSFRVFAQVKTTRRGLSFDIKLDALDLACKEPAPWFLIAVVLGSDDLPRDVFVVPYDDKVIALVLKRLRKEHHEGTTPSQLHKKTTRIRAFQAHRISPDDASAFRDRILDAVGDPATASDRKLSLVRTLGYERNRATATVHLADGETDESMVDAILGLRPEVRLKSYVVEDRRFDIPVVVNKLSGDLAISFTPQSAGPTVLSVVRDDGRRCSVSLDTFIPPRVDSNLFKVRCANRFMDFVFGRGETAKVSVKVGTGPVSLSELAAVGRVVLAMARGGADGSRIEVAHGDALESFALGPAENDLPPIFSDVLEPAVDLADVLRRLGHDQFDDSVNPDDLGRIRPRVAQIGALLNGDPAFVSTKVPVHLNTPRATVLFCVVLPLRTRLVVLIAALDGKAHYESSTDGLRRMTTGGKPRLVQVRSFDRRPAESLGMRCEAFLELVAAGEAERLGEDIAVLESWLPGS